MLLSEARTQVAQLVDDEAAEKYSTTEIDNALKTAQLETWQHAVGSGSNAFNVDAAFTSTSAGVVDLSSVAPRRIVSVAHVVSTRRLKVQPVRFDDSPQDHASAESLRIVYVPKVTFPASAGTAFTWGHANIDTSMFDQLMSVIAASHLKIKESEVNAMMERRKDELRALVLETLSIPTWTVVPLDSLAGRSNGSADFSYVMTAPHTMQLVDL